MPKSQVTCQFIHMPNSYQIYICSIHVVLHMSRFMFYKVMLNLHRSSFIPKITCLTCLHQFTHNEFQPNYIYQDPCHITYIKIHVKLYMPIPILVITPIMIIPKYSIFMLYHQFHQTHISKQVLSQDSPVFNRTQIVVQAQIRN